ncbi:MAG: hypothetical protein ABW199_09430 [Caulobacterales bacterium]
MTLQDWRVDTVEGLRLAATFDGDSAIFAAFFSGYDEAFVLPDEKEDEAGFRRCLALNHGADHVRLSSSYGPFREVCLVADDISSGRRIGGANFIATFHHDMVTANLNYIYIEKAARGQGAFGRLVSAVSGLIGRIFHTPHSALVFIEQNDPFAMSAEAYARDTQFTGLDQFDRLRIWAGRGARVVDHAYVQPPLSAEQAADDTLVYSVLGARDETLSACVLATHLERFFGISVLKGAPLESSPTAIAQIEALNAACAANQRIRLFDPQMLLSNLKGDAAARARAEKRYSTFRQALRAID